MVVLVQFFIHQPYGALLQGRPVLVPVKFMGTSKVFCANPYIIKPVGQVAVWHSLLNWVSKTIQEHVPPLQVKAENDCSFKWINPEKMLFFWIGCAVCPFVRSRGLQFASSKGPNQLTVVKGLPWALRRRLQGWWGGVEMSVASAQSTMESSWTTITTRLASTWHVAAARKIQ